MLIKNDILNDYEINLNWKTLYVALHLDFIDCSVIEDYALKILSDESYVENEFINDLIWEGKDLQKEEVLMKILIEVGIEEFEKGSESWNIEMRKLRYYLLKLVKNTVTNNKDLLDKVSEIYADVGYPVEMEEFITYMPPKDSYDPTRYSVEENNIHMITLLDKFLENEKEFLKILYRRKC